MKWMEVFWKDMKAYDVHEETGLAISNDEMESHAQLIQHALDKGEYKEEFLFLFCFRNEQHRDL